MISNTQYNAFGSIASLTHYAVRETRQYNILGQMTRMTAFGIDQEYRFSATQNDGKIVSQKNWQTGEDVTGQYDDLERVIGAQTTNNTTWGLSWKYDGFCNRLSQGVTQGSAPINTVGVDASTNRIASSGYANDANGNLTAMPHGAGSMSLSYDHSNRLSNASYPGGNTEDYRYAPDNRRIWRNKGRNSGQAISDDGYIFALQNENASEQVIFYSPDGQKMGVYCVTFGYYPSFPGTTQIAITASEENVYFGARLVAKRHITQTLLANGNTTSFDVDRLHSKGDGSKYFPYGENKGGGTADDREQFATYTRDQSTGLDYADQRYYASSLGRFLASDPLSKSFNPKDPNSANRYGYATSDPANFIDPEGLVAESTSGTRLWNDCYSEGRDFCGGGGGGWGVGGVSVTSPQDLALAYGLIQPAQTLTADTVDWNNLVNHLNLSIEAYTYGGSGQSAGRTILEYLLQNGPLTINYPVSNVAPIAIPITIGIGEVLIDIVGATITWTIAKEAIQEFFKRKPAWTVTCYVHPIGG